MLPILLSPFVLMGLLAAPIMLSDYKTPHAVIFDRTSRSSNQDIEAPVNFKVTWLYEEETLTNVYRSYYDKFKVWPENVCEKETSSWGRQWIHFKNRETRKIGLCWMCNEDDSTKIERHLILTQKVFSDLSVDDLQDVETFIEEVSHSCGLADPFTKQSILLLIEEEKVKIRIRILAEEKARKALEEERRHQEQQDLIRQQNETIKQMAARPPVVVINQTQPVVIHHVEPTTRKKQRKEKTTNTQTYTPTKQQEEEKEKAYERSAMIEGW
jgi:hypothetical protein